MKPVSLKCRNAVMRRMIDLHYAKATPVRPQDLRMNLFSSDADIDQVIDVLIGSGDLSATEYIDGSRVISVTNSGLAFFERLIDERQRFIRRSILVPIVVAFATTVLTTAVWPLLLKSLLQLPALLQ